MTSHIPAARTSTGAATLASSRGSVLRAAALLAVLSAPGVGCYERVVGAKGMGATDVDIEEPYQEDTFVDRWIFGTSKPEPNSSHR